MTLEQQVVSLELAKKLKELGVKQESLFYWYLPNNHGPYLRQDRKELGEHWKNNQIYSAFTVAELGEMLPQYVQDGAEGYAHLVSTKEGKNFWYITYRHSDIIKRESARTEADARAKMLIHLVENKLISLQ